VVGEDGCILAVNKAWIAFAHDNSARLEDISPGANYFVYSSPPVQGGDQENTAELAIREVLAGRETVTAYQYDCHSPDEQRWFCARITRLPGSGAARALVVHEDVTSRKHAEMRVARLLRLYGALRQSNVSIGRAVTRQELFQQVCDIAVGLGDFKVASVRRIDEKTHLLQDMAHSGDDKGYFASVRISMLAHDPDGSGPISVALRKGQTTVVQDFAEEPGGRPGVVFAARAGIRSYAAFPLFLEGYVFGVFSVYAEAPNVFEPELVELLEALATDLSFGLQRLVHVAERNRSEHLSHLQVERANLLTKLGASALTELSSTDLMVAAATLGRDTLGFEFATIWQLSPNGDELSQRAAVGWPHHSLANAVVPIADAGEIKFALERLEPVLVDDFSSDNRFTISHAAASAHCTSALILAIPGGSSPYGALAVYSRGQLRLRDDDTPYLQSIANLVAAAIHRDHAAEQLAHMAQFDAPTGLPNRQLFRDRLAQALIQSKRSGRATATLTIRLNRFKLVNETFGHSFGDELVLLVARRITESLRPGDSNGRLESDIFGVVLSDLAKPEDAILATQKIHLSLEESFLVQGESVFVSACIGIAAYPENGDSHDELMSNAYTAMQRVKQQEGSGFQFYTAQMNVRSIERLRLESELHQAFEREEFVVYYQPKIDIATGQISGAESLIRWRHPQRGLVFPGDFIGVLEETGLIVQVGLWVLRNACEQVSRWTEAGIPIPKISINVSPRQFQNRDFAERVGGVIAASGINAGHIELEITETMLMVDPSHAVSELAKLKSLGVGLSVDDFGTGYSSLSYLKKFPLDTLKIDIAFIRDTCTDPDSAAITLAIISLARSLRLTVVAEGVETAPQFNFLARHGCDQLQGYLFSKPIEVKAFEHMLLNDVRLNVPRTHRSVQPTLLIVDGNDVDSSRLVHLLDGEGYRIFTAGDPKSAFQLLSEVECQTVISSSEFGHMSGIEFLAQVRQMYPSIGRVIEFEVGDPQEIVQAVNAAGIQKFLFKEWPKKRIQETIRAASEGYLLATAK
jgi:diguanylate cyclase (GGDEF)-like protein